MNPGLTTSSRGPHRGGQPSAVPVLTERNEHHDAGVSVHGIDRRTELQADPDMVKREHRNFDFQRNAQAGDVDGRKEWIGGVFLLSQGFSLLDSGDEAQASRG